MSFFQPEPFSSFAFGVRIVLTQEVSRKSPDWQILKDYLPAGIPKILKKIVNYYRFLRIPQNFRRVAKGS